VSGFLNYELALSLSNKLLLIRRGASCVRRLDVLLSFHSVLHTNNYPIVTGTPSKHHRREKNRYVRFGTKYLHYHLSALSLFYFSNMSSLQHSNNHSGDRPNTY
jgi:hypothetical protein